MQVETLSIVANEALQERIAVLGGPIASLHGLACGTEQ